jgi:hypothetical protein
VLPTYSSISELKKGTGGELGGRVPSVPARGRLRADRLEMLLWSSVECGCYRMLLWQCQISRQSIGSQAFDALSYPGGIRQLEADPSQSHSPLDSWGEVEGWNRSRLRHTFNFHRPLATGSIRPITAWPGADIGDALVPGHPMLQMPDRRQEAFKRKKQMLPTPRPHHSKPYAGLAYPARP